MTCLYSSSGYEQTDLLHQMDSLIYSLVETIDLFVLKEPRLEVKLFSTLVVSTNSNKLERKINSVNSFLPVYSMNQKHCTIIFGSCGIHYIS